MFASHCVERIKVFSYGVQVEADGDPQLVFDEDGTPRSARFGDIYYSPEDGLSETRAVFFEGCALPQKWQGRSGFTVLELGFGTGLNIVALLELWSRTRESYAWLDVFTVEGFLMPREAAARALSVWPELSAFSESMLAQWPLKRRGLHVMEFPQWGARVTVATQPVAEALSQWDIQADAIFLDGFSPAQNPDMWSDSILAEVGRLSAPGARIGTFTVAGHVRRSLMSAGFDVAKAPGFGRKRERLEAIFPGERPTFNPPQTLAVIGAGIAGASVAFYARQAGLRVDVYDHIGPGSGASGNAAALVTPRLDAGNTAISRLYADAVYHATGLYQRLCPTGIIGTGVHLKAGDTTALSRLTRIANQDVFVTGDMALSEAGLFQKMAAYIYPQDILAALLEGVEVQTAMAVPEPTHGVWQVAGKTYDAVVMACGEGVFDQPLLNGLKLGAVRGQVEISPDKGPDQAQSGDGYVIPLPNGFLFGATHDRGDRGCDIRDGSQQANLETLHRLTGLTPDPVHLSSRARIRVTTRDYLPVCGQMSPRLWALSGMGARGFCLAPWLGMSLVAQMCGQGDPAGIFTRNLITTDRKSVTAAPV